MLLLGTLLCAPDVRADVVREEPNPDTVNQSDVIALAVVDSVQGKKPFLHKAAPQVTFKVREGIKGCEAGEKLQVSQWITKGKPLKEKLPPPNYEADMQAWKISKVNVPQKGTPVLLFLKKTGKGTLEQTMNGWDVPIWFEKPTDEVIAATWGLLVFEAELRLENRRLTGTIKNVSDGPQTFVPAQVLVTRLDTPMQTFKYRRDVPKPRADGLPVPVPLQPGESKPFDWELDRFVGVPLTVPGRYSVSLQVPAVCNGTGTLAEFQFEVAAAAGAENHNVLDIARQARMVFTAVAGPAVAQPDGTTQVVLLNRYYLKGGKQSREVPHQVQWPSSFPVPKEGDRLILCYGKEIVHVEPENPATVEQLKKILLY